jgi:RNA polymerase sigma-70 factor (ECF subfamily)
MEQPNSNPDGDPTDAPSSGTPANTLTDLTRYWLRAQPPVAAYVSAAVWNAHDAEDVVQQVAEVCAVRFAEFDHSRSFLRWALGIARFEVLRYYRKHQQTSRAELRGETLDLIAAEMAGRETELEDRYEALKECMQKIVGRSKQMLEMRYYRDLKDEEIASRIGLTTGAVRVALFRVRQELGNCIRRRIMLEEQPNV